MSDKKEKKKRRVGVRSIVDIKMTALKYQTRGAFKKHDNSIYQSALKKGVIDEVCGHMEFVNTKWTKESITKIASNYETRYKFQKKQANAYAAAFRLGVIDEVCGHMKSRYKKWNTSDVALESLKFTTRYEFQKKSNSAYNYAIRFNILDEVCSHMEDMNWTYKKIKLEALNYQTISGFRKNTAYRAAQYRGIVDEVCGHMKRAGGISKPEIDLMDIIKQEFPKAIKLIDGRVTILDKPHIKRLEIDIYIPELRKGIEFDGDYWHSLAGLKRGRPDWSTDDLENYHQIKDDYFLSKGIPLLHITEKEWKNNKIMAINKCMNFLQIEMNYER